MPQPRSEPLVRPLAGSLSDPSGFTVSSLSATDFLFEDSTAYLFEDSVQFEFEDAPTVPSYYLRPGGVDYYRRPGGVDRYLRP